MRILRAISAAARNMVATIYRYRRMLAAITRVELAKRHAGSVLGFAWVVLQPALLLSVYVFVYMVVLRMRFEGFSRFDYVLYVFCGLVPYLGFMEALTTGGLSVKQNMHLVKNVMLPIELIPIRSVLVGMASQFVSIGLVLLLVAADRSLTWHVALLPLVVLLQVMWLAGLTWVLASVTVALPDITYFVNLFVFLLMFLSPIGYRPDMVPKGFGWIIYLNPIYYMTEMFRGTMLNGPSPRAAVAIIYALMCLATFALGSAFFERFRGVLTDYE
ncbi:MAG: O-antigen export system permease [Acidobacteria bacterium]|nr:MAG: O-antigen export system permease [Acidobacteriota bacterium]